MNALDVIFRGETLSILASGALHWPAQGLLCVSDLHLGKSERLARRGGAILPPYETRDTLDRLQADLAATGARRVLCLGDSFDDLAAGAALPAPIQTDLTVLMAGRDWIWIEGNHDPGPLDLGGTHRAEFALGPFTFRHIAAADPAGEVSGHYHPKARLSLRGRSLSRPCVLFDDRRLILPAYGTYTGGLYCDRPELARLMGPTAQVVLLGPKPTVLPYARVCPAP
jgi:DNA ligase-associated metallophosphoesterase